MEQKQLADKLIACKTPEELQQIGATPTAVKQLEASGLLNTTDTNRILSVIDPNYDW